MSRGTPQSFHAQQQIYKPHFHQRRRVWDINKVQVLTFKPCQTLLSAPAARTALGGSVCQTSRTVATQRAGETFLYRPVTTDLKLGPVSHLNPCPLTYSLALSHKWQRLKI